MKWNNKGHEFDTVYENIKKNSRIYLFGAGEYGREVCALLKNHVHICGFLDNSKDKQGKEYCGIEVLAPEQVSAEEEGICVILCISPNDRKPVIHQLMAHGFCYNQNLFTMEVYLSVYYAYALNQLYFPSVSFLPSTRCNLNCEACLNFTPYMEHFDERPWSQITADVDVFFQSVDYIMLFHISGGEPMLYPKIGELIEYIDVNYREKIHILKTVTNGTVLPGEDLVKKLAEHKVVLTVDDYREAVPESAGTFDKLLRRLETFGVQYEINRVDQWIDLDPLNTHHEEWSEERLGKKFDGCHVPWQELRARRLYSCNYASYAAVAGLCQEQPGDSYDLTLYEKSQVKELMEFRMGYNEKGYVEFCRHCSGYVDLNPNIVKPAVQAKRRKG